MPRKRRPPRPGALAELAPLRILTRIALLQLAYYACAAVLLVFSALVAGEAVGLDLLLSWRTLRGDTTVGWMLALVWMLDSLVTVLFIVVLVARSKLVPDFACTLHFIHLVITSLYSRSLPTNWLWWALQAMSAALMTILGVSACQWRELKPISFGGNNSAAQNASKDQGGSEGAGEEEVGFSRGRGRGRGRDGAGEYEMVGMNPQEP